MKTLSFINAYKSVVSPNHSDDTKIVRTVNGGKFPGTWMNKILAYKFAAWLDPKFEVFVYNVFDEVVKKHIEQTKEKIENQQRQLDYFWDKEDQNDIYKRK